MENNQTDTTKQFNPEQNRKSRQLTISDAIVLFFVSVLAYGFLYVSESEYFKYFGISTVFMNFEVQELVPIIKDVILFPQLTFSIVC